MECAPDFKNVASEVGIDFSFYTDTVEGRFFLPEIMGGGAAWFDFDADSRLDLYLMNGSALDPTSSSAATHRDQLYRGSIDGLFRKSPEICEAGDSGYGQGCAAGDFDADGFMDLYLGNYGANVLLHNNGDGTFTDVTSRADVGDPLWTSSVVWLDIDLDNDLDIYVTNYLDARLDNIELCDYAGRRGYCGPGSFTPLPDHVYLNQSDGTFVESSAALGIVDSIGKGLAVAVVDLDGDLLPEIYVANDMTPNFLFVPSRDEQGSVQYREIATLAGCAQSGDGMNEASMGIACLDFDRDQRVDIYLTHYYQMKNTLYRNMGNLQFDDISRRVGVAKTSHAFLGFGTTPIDYDRDGFDDLFITNGHVLGPENEPNEMRAQLLRNDVGKQFVDISNQAGEYFEILQLGRGAASADYDDDGDLDILVTHLDQPAALLRNDTKSGGHFLGLQLSTSSRIPPLGARVRVITSDGESVRTVMAGGSYLSDGDDRQLFSLGETTESVDLEVSWPSGEIQLFYGLAVDQYWRIHEGCDPEVATN